MTAAVQYLTNLAAECGLTWEQAKELDVKQFALLLLKGKDQES